MSSEKVITYPAWKSHHNIARVENLVSIQKTVEDESIAIIEVTDNDRFAVKTSGKAGATVCACRIYLSDGSRKWVAVNQVTLKDDEPKEQAEGAIMDEFGFSCTGFDITMVQLESHYFKGDSIIASFSDLYN